MKLIGLRRARPGNGVDRKQVAFQDGHLLEMAGQRSRSRQPADPGPDDDGVPADDRGHRRMSRPGGDARRAARPLRATRWICNSDLLTL